MGQAHSFASPLLTMATDTHSGSLPTHHSFVSVDEGSFEITALKRSEDGNSWILRGHETTGRAGHVTVSLDRPLGEVWLTDLVETPIRPIPLKDAKIEFDCNPFEFVTLRLSVKE